MPFLYKIKNIMHMANWGFRASKVRIKLFLHCLELYRLEELKDMDDMLHAFATYKAKLHHDNYVLNSRRKGLEL